MILRILKTAQAEIIVQLKLRAGVALSRLELHHQRILDRKDRVIRDVLVSPIKYLRDERFVARRGDDKVDMRRPHRMTIEQLEQLARGPIIRDGIAGRPQTIQGVVTVGGRVEASAQVHIRLVGVLLLVEAVGRRVPDVELGAGDGLAADEVGHAPEHVGVVGVGEVVEHDAVAHVALGRVLAPEGAEDGRRGGQVVGGGGERVGDFVDEGFDAEDVVHELGLVAAVVGHFTRPVDLRDTTC